MAESFIRGHGDGAYDYAVQLAVCATLCEDHDEAEVIADAAKELMRRGYHKKKAAASP
jgi:hypothetical protein